MTTPLVSIVVPCFNYGHLLSQTLESIKNQSLSDWECLIVDDGSTDNTGAVASGFSKSDPRFRYIFQDNQGLSAARNTGMLTSRGVFIQFLDADDLLSPDKLALQVRAMLDHEDIDLSYTKVVYFPDGDTTKRYKSFRFNGRHIEFGDEGSIKAFDSCGSEVVRSLLFDNLAPVNCFLVRRSKLSEVGNFRTDYKSIEDWEFWWRCAYQGLKFSFLEDDRAFAMVRVHPTSMTSNQNRMLLFQIRFYHEALSSLKHCPVEAYQQIWQKDVKEIQLRIRHLIRTLGLLNFILLKEVIRVLGVLTFLKLYFKEVNAVRRRPDRKPNRG